MNFPPNLSEPPPGYPRMLPRTIPPPSVGGGSEDLSFPMRNPPPGYYGGQEQTKSTNAQGSLQSSKQYSTPSSSSGSTREGSSSRSSRASSLERKRESERRMHRGRSSFHTRHRSPSSREHERRSRSEKSKERRSEEPRRERRSCSQSQRAEPKKKETERELLLAKWRRNYCETSEDITRKLAELADDKEKEHWIRSSPADVYYKRVSENVVEGTTRLDALCSLFEVELVQRAEKIKDSQTPYNPPPRKRKTRFCRHKSEKCSSSDSSDDDLDLEEDCTMEELSRKINHPYRLHTDLWYNEAGEMNDGPLCRCSAKSRRSGIRHGIYPGENGFPKCQLNSNNADRLYHYRITISPPTNFLTKTPTIIKYDQHEFLFEGFSLLSHVPIGELPTCKVIRFNIEYTVLYIEEKMPENFTIRELDLFYAFLFTELLELVDFNLRPNNTATDICPFFHFLPRFVRDLSDNGKEVLAMSEVLRYLLDNSGLLVDRRTLADMMHINQNIWQDYVDDIKGMVVTNPGMKPCSVRVDQLDRNVSDLPECRDSDGVVHPVIVHFGIRPPQLSYAGNPEYQKAWREYVKYRHLIANMSKPTYDDKRRLEAKEAKLQEMRMLGRMKRNITVAVSSKSFHRTGIMCDMVQHAMLIPVLTCHLRFHRSLDVLEENIGYKFQNRYLLQLALTHPSYKENFGTNPDHARNSLTNCGIRQPEYGDRKIHYMNTRKRGINTLINIMSRFGKEYETDSNITHNERLEFLGDAVVEFLTSIHLFFMFPDLEEGGLATYRAAIVQNQHLAVLAKKLHLEEFMLYAHGSDLCHELELRHAMANCFEALMGALLLDGGIEVADKVFASALFLEADDLKKIWENNPPHPLQEQEPLGDRQWIGSYQMLQNLTKFEDSIGVKFRHIRLLARAFTDRSIGFTHLTLGSNQRLEFLGDTVLQLICSEYLYRHFPEHHEGHLSLLRSSLVNNRTQAVVCDDLGMTQYAVYSNPKAELKTKDRADLLEAFLGALYVDKGLEYCQTFCHVCLFPRLNVFIMNQDWNDPKSKLQQCCLTLRSMDGGEPDIPVYKVIESIGPTNTRVYTVAVYFREKRLACATGHSIQQAEMNAAKKALENSQDLFPQLDHQKRVIARSVKRQKGSSMESKRRDIPLDGLGIDKKFSLFDDSNLPKQYRSREDISSEEDFSDSESSSNDSSMSSLSEKSVKVRPVKSRKRKRSPDNEDSKEDLQDILSSVSDEEMPEEKVTYEDAAEIYKVAGTEDLSSDLESGELV
ncbi:ribonuclease 3 [Phlebotomus argentipes]|uniref:ribonuclease 3 n=1 Tax=Phlebotomus argentipes TaxID=94469 RepID=UPI0028937390|nr:ribonuclease 3 [Phlebotomus argentipes]